MNEPHSEEKQYKLSNLVVHSIGLVRRGANRKPFMFVKSADGQGENMDDKKQDVQVETPSNDELEEFRAWKAAQAEPPEAPPEPTVDFAEALAQQEKRLTEQFAAKLDKERERGDKLAEAFADEQRRRRLMEFTDQAATFNSLPVGGTEQFGEDLMILADTLPKETYERLLETLRASNEAVSQGALFSQFAQPVRADEYGDPFLTKVEGLKAEILKASPLKDPNEAFSEAMRLAGERYRDEARAYAIRSIPGGE
jgi:hypothetical protein